MRLFVLLLIALFSVSCDSRGAATEAPRGSSTTDRTAAIVDKTTLQIERYSGDDLTKRKLRAAVALGSLVQGWEVTYIKGYAALQETSAGLIESTLSEVFSISAPQLIADMKHQNPAQVENVIELPSRTHFEIADMLTRSEPLMGMMFAFTVIRLDLYTYLDDYADATSRGDAENIKETGRQILEFYSESGLRFVYFYSPFISAELAEQIEKFADVLRSDHLKDYSHEQIVQLQSTLDAWYDRLFEYLLTNQDTPHLLTTP